MKGKADICKWAVLLLLHCAFLNAQELDMTIDGEIVTAIPQPDGDTIYISTLDDVSITAKRKFASKREYLVYQRYRQYAVKVYPYAVKAIRVFRELEENTAQFKKGKRRKEARKLKKQLQDEFEIPLKKLTKTQGRILVHMIEKELDTPMYFLIKDLRGGVTARYWNTAAGLYGYHLRKGYIRGEDEIMDMVLDDFDISHGK